MDPIFQGSGEMRALCRALEWAATPLGPSAHWPQSLRTAVQLVLASPFPNIILWGDQLIQIYNDAYRELMGNKHPAGLSQPTRQCWPEVWSSNEPIYQRVWAGESVSLDDALYPITRSGQLQDAWFRVAYSPVLAESGQVGGILMSVFETTQRVLEQRRHQHAERQKDVALQISDALAALAALADPVELQTLAARLLGEHLGADRAYYTSIEGDYEVAVVEREYRRGQVPSVIGRHTFAPFGSAFAAFKAGRATVLDDSEDEMLLPESERPPFRALSIRAMISVPLVKNHRTVGGLTVLKAQPHHWSVQEIALVVETAERTWAAVERAHAEEALQISEARLATIFQILPVGLAEVNMQGRVVLANQAMARYLPTGIMPSQDTERIARWQGEDSEGRPLAPTDFPGARALRGERVIPPVEMRYTADNGRTVWTQVVALPIRDKHDQIRGHISMVIDIDELKQAQASLLQADRRKDEFLAMLAHELRNPMATLRSGLQILAITDGKDQTSHDTIVAATVAMMNRQTDHLVRMVDDLLDVSRISQGKIELKTQRINLVEVVAQAAESIQILYQEQGRRLHLDLPSAPIYLEGDATRLSQVVTNLLTNGVRYTGASGQVWLSLIQETGPPGGQQATLQVRDDGIGLAPDQLSAIFDLFVQVDNSVARSKGGLGLGLTLVKRLVELHGGRVEAHSKGIGAGSTFGVHLPTLSRASKSSPTPAQGDSADVAAQRILVVDDNADAALMLSMLLKLKGYEVHSRQSGQAGLEAVERLKPGVVLLDIGMPDMDGYETARAIRQQPWGRDVILLAITGYGGAEDKQRAREAGFDGHLVKPVDVGVLTALLTKLLPGDYL